MDVMENIKILLVRNMKLRRKHLGINQEELAEKSNLSTAYIKNIERGVSWPSPESFEAISSGLGISISDLLSEAPLKQPDGGAVSIFAKKVMSIPDDIYEKAQGFEHGDELWEDIRGVLSHHVKKRDRILESKKNA